MTGPPGDRSAAGADTTGAREEAGNAGKPSATSLPAQPRKWQRTLREFLDRGARGLNRFECAREVRDHVLPTTVSQLERRGVRILRCTETVPGFMGAPTDCARYWLAPESRARAQELLGIRP